MDGLQISLFIILPFLVVQAENRSTLVRTLSAVVICYGLGIVFGNTLFVNESSRGISETIAGIAVTMAIPLLLLSTNIPKWLKLAPSTIGSFVMVVVSVVLVSFSAAFVFDGRLPEIEKASSMLVGIYTGGTPNMSAIGLSLEANENLFVALNTADIVLGGVYLLFILSVGKMLLGKWLKPFRREGKRDMIDESNTWALLSYKIRVFRVILYLLFGIVIVGIGSLLSGAIFGKDVITFIILFITTSGIGLSFHSRLRNLPGTYEVGNYLLMVFCIAVGSMANVQELIDLGPVYLQFVAYCMLLAIFIHLVGCKLFGIDRDTAIITSIAGIYGPAFVGPMASSLGNKQIIVSGMTTGLVGYAIGNYLGLLLYQALLWVG